MAEEEKEERLGKIHQAVLDRDLEAVSAAIHDVNDRRPESGNTPLHLVSTKGTRQADVEIAEKLLAAGAKVNARNAHQCTPLMQVCSSGNHRVVKQLIDAGADLEARNERNERALHFASKAGSGGVVAPAVGSRNY